jgi:hypothetical protein
VVFIRKEVSIRHKERPPQESKLMPPKRPCGEMEMTMLGQVQLLETPILNMKIIA